MYRIVKAYEDRVRYRARRELRERPEQEVLSALDKWVAGLSKSDPDYWRQMLEALWLHQSLDDIDVALLERVLACPEPRARAAATRVACYWRDRLRDPLELLRKQVNDSHPRVRLEAVRALSFLDGDDADKAQEIALESLVHPQDDYLEKLIPVFAAAAARLASATAVRSNSGLEKSAVRLAGLWRLESAAEPLRKIAQSAADDESLRCEAIEALAAIGGPAGRTHIEVRRCGPARGLASPGSRRLGEARCRSGRSPIRRGPYPRGGAGLRLDALVGRISQSPGRCRHPGGCSGPV